MTQQLTINELVHHLRLATTILDTTIEQFFVVSETVESLKCDVQSMKNAIKKAEGELCSR